MNSPGNFDEFRNPTAEIVLMNVRDASAALVEHHHASFTKAFMRSYQNFVWIEKESFIRDDRILAVVIENDEVTAGLHYDRTEFSESPCIYFKGLFSNSRTKGLASRLIMRSFSYEAATRKESFGALATVRKYPDGSFNPAAVKVFSRLGFRAHSGVEVLITASNRDRHLIASANTNTEGKCAFEVMHMYCADSDAREIAATEANFREGESWTK